MHGSDIGGRTWFRRSSALGLLATAVLTVACSGSSTPSGAAPSNAEASRESQSSAGGDLTGIFEIPTDPIDIGVVLDPAKSVVAIIPIEGGTLSATGGDGTVYTLDIPADALLTATTIGLTPVASTSGMPFGNDETYAVQLSPEGLFFYSAAILTIAPAQAIPIDEQIVFGYEGDGTDLILAAPVVDSAEIKIQVRHFSGNGVTRGLLADIEPVRQRLGGDAERRMSEAVSEELMRSRQRALGGLEGDAPDATATYAEAWRRYVEQVVKVRVSSAGESCAAGRLAIQTVLSLAYMRGVMGQDPGNGLNDYPGLVDKAARVCILEEFELCAEEHVIHRMAGVWRNFERQYALMGVLGVPVDDAVLREARELAIKCLTFNLKFESTGTVKTGGGGGYESTVTSDLTLRFNPEEDRITGEAPLVNEAFEWFVPVCNVTGIPGGGGPFRVINLKILSAKPDETHGDTNFLLSYAPGETSESATISCPDGPTVTIPAGAYWSGNFATTHAAELDTGGYVAIDWEVFGNEYFATKEWVKEDGEFADVGTFKLYHTPGQ